MKWRTHTVQQICQAMRNDNDYTALPILADALEEAGYEDEKSLAFFRGDRTYRDDVRQVALIYSEETAEAVRWVEMFADTIDIGYRNLMGAASRWAESEDYEGYTHMGENEGYKQATNDQWVKFWESYTKITGLSVANERQESGFFSCSC